MSSPTKNLDFSIPDGYFTNWQRGMGLNEWYFKPMTDWRVYEAAGVWVTADGSGYLDGEYNSKEDAMASFGD